MYDRYSLKGWALGTIALLALSAWPTGVQAQDGQQVTGRFQVLIPAFEPMNGAKDNLGKDIAKELRELIEDLVTHQPVEEKELKAALRQFDIDEDDLDCIRARQLASQMQVNVVVCGTVSPASGEKMFDITSKFVTVETGEEFVVDGFTAGEKDKEVASQQIFDAFETLVQQQRHAQFCGEYAQSQQWDNALENCDKAIELNPTNVSSMYTRGMIFVNQERFEDAIVEFRRVLELNPIHENGLKAAGFAATKAGDGDAALGYYKQFLDLNPGDAQVRMNIAYEAATAGDSYGAMVLIDEGIVLEPENIDLWQQKGGYAMSAAERIFQQNGNEVNEEAAGLYRGSIEAYDKVYAARSDEVNVSQRRNVVSAYQRLGDLEMAQSAAEQALGTWPEEAQLWSVNADVLQKMGRLEDAIAALDRVTQIDPEYRNVRARQGMWLLEAERNEEAVVALQDAVARGEQSADNIANIFFSNGHKQGVQPQVWGKAVEMFRQADQFAEGEDVKTKIGFWLGYGLLKHGQGLQEPNTLATAQRTQPMFQESLRRLQGATGYAELEESVTVAQIQNLVNAANQFLEIQAAIIKRGS